MPRTARQSGSTNIYHVILRGINKQQIFFDEEDYEYFIRLLERFKSISHYELYAYCLMGNHVHLLIKASEEPLSRIFRRIGASFVYWYNLKYQRTGHLFQDRFKSEAVEDERYFLTVLRYIFNNPVKAGMCDSPEDYPYSNIKDFISKKNPALPCDISTKDLLNFIMQSTDETCMEISETPRKGVTEETAKKLILDELGIIAPVISSENRSSIEVSIRRLSKKGVSIRQLSRLTGISKSMIEKMLKGKTGDGSLS